MRALTIGALKSPESGYFAIWIFTQAAVVGLLLGWIVVEPQMWWRNLLTIVAIIALTWMLYHAYRIVGLLFRRLDKHWGIR